MKSAQLNSLRGRTWELGTLELGSGSQSKVHQMFARAALPGLTSSTHLQNSAYKQTVTIAMDPLSMISAAISVAVSIDKLVTTLKRNVRECGDVGSRVRRLVPILNDLHESFSTCPDSKVRAPIAFLDALINILGEAEELVASCADVSSTASTITKARRTFAKAWNADDTAQAFVSVNQKIDSVLQELTLLQTTQLLVRMKTTDGDRVGERFRKDPPQQSPDDENSILGRGSFAVTFRMVNSKDGRVYAVKRVNTVYAAESGVTRLALARECEILQRLTHPHIARYFLDYDSHDDQYFNIVMELVEGGTLAKKVMCTPAPTEVVIVEWARQMASAMSYMHGEGVLHRDLKPDNVMLTSSSKIKFIDFGLASAFTSEACQHTQVGAPTYSSYEKLCASGYDGRDDVWAVGCILLELVIRARYALLCTLSATSGGYLPHHVLPLQATERNLSSRRSSSNRDPRRAARPSRRRLSHVRRRGPAPPAATTAGKALYFFPACSLAGPAARLACHNSSYAVVQTHCE
jgi:predicted Ser/Thr protein kinase